MSEENTNATTAATEKAARIAKAKVELSGNVLSFVFANGETLKADYDMLTADLQKRAALHGLEQKIRDSYAGAKSADEAQGMAQKVLDGLYHPTEPKWNAGRAEGGVSEDTVDMLYSAMVAAYEKAGKTVPNGLREGITNADRATRAKMRAIPAVGLELARIKAERSTATLDDLTF